MTADWTTCRVVRDRDGDLWGRLGDDWVSLLPGATDSFPSDWLMSALGPLVPVLDADGVPVVQHLWNPMTNQTWCGAGERATESMAEARPRIPVCACCHIQAMHWRADHPVVTTVGDLTARHVGRRVRLDEHYDAKLETIFFHEGGEVSLNFTHPEGFTYGCSRAINTPCEVLP